MFTYIYTHTHIFFNNICHRFEDQDHCSFIKQVCIALWLYKLLSSCPSIHLSTPSFIPKIFIEGNIVQWGFPGGSGGRESAYNGGDLDSIPGLGRYPGGGHGNSLQYSCLENPHGQRSLEGYRPWVCKESDKTKRLSTNSIVHNSINSSLPRLGSFFKSLV